MTQRKTTANKTTASKSRASKTTSARSAASTTSASKSTTAKTSTAKTSARKTTASKTVSKELRELIDELAAARERAGRAEARAEMLDKQIEQMQAGDKESKGPRSAAMEALKAENSVLRERVDFLQEQTEELRRRLISTELDSVNEDAGGEPLVPPEEEDEFLAMTQRWRAAA